MRAWKTGFTAPGQVDPSLVQEQTKTDPQIQRTHQWLPGERKEERGKVGVGEEEEQTTMYKVDKLQEYFTHRELVILL